MLLQICTPDSCTPFNANIHTILQVLVSAFFMILFLQSGFDKVSNRKGNLEWLGGHFAKSPLKGMVPLLLTVITLLELAAGTFSAAGIVVLLVNQCDYWLFWGNLLAAVSLLCLFFGQRMAKDYAGAQGLVGYFIVALAGLWLCGGC
jgi:hypothetical protein